MTHTNQNHAIEQVARALDDLPAMVARFLPGFDESNRAAQAPGLPNHLIWTLGHLSLYHHRSAERIAGVDPGPLPESDFVTADGRSGDAKRFDTESVSFASTPSPDASIFPTLARGIEIHTSACARLSAVVRGLDDATCQREVMWGAAAPTTALILAVRMSHHVGTHVGQLLDLRRALGLPRLFG